MSSIPTDYLMAVYGVRSHVMACVTRLVNEDRYVSPDECRQMGLEALRLMEEQDARIRGNRPDSQPITWQDARLELAATLREALRVLGEGGGE